MGKGSKRRPAAVSDEELERRWRLAFGSDPDVNPAAFDEAHVYEPPDPDYLARGDREEG